MILTSYGIQLTSYLVVLCLISLWCWYQYKNRRTLKFARSLATLKPTLPILGHILYCLPDLDGVISNFALGLSLQAASDKVAAFCLWAGPKPFIVIQNPDDIQLLLNSTKSLEKGDDYRLIKFALGDGLFTAPVRLWKPIRRQIQPMFHPQNVELMVPRFNEQGMQIAKEMIDYVGQSPVDLLPIISKYVVSSTGHLVFGNTSLIDFDPKSIVVQEVYKSISRSLELFSIRIVKIWLQWDILFNWYYNADLQQVRSSQDFAQMIVRDFRKRFNLQDKDATKLYQDSSSQYLIADAFFPLIKSNPETITDQSMCDSINNILGAATDTTSTVLASCLLTLAKYPAVQTETTTVTLGGEEYKLKKLTSLCFNLDISVLHFVLIQRSNRLCQEQAQPSVLNMLPEDKVVEEIHSEIGSYPTDISTRAVRCLTYMDQVLKETMRRFTVAPYISRKIVEDISTSSGVIPAGTSVYLDTYGNHMSPHMFLNPDQFDPDRFLPENVVKRRKLAFMQFSAGPRNCIGKEYAMISMKIALVHILRRFKFSTEENIVMSKFQYHATLSRIGGYPVRIEERR